MGMSFILGAVGFSKPRPRAVATLESEYYEVYMRYVILKLHKEYRSAILLAIDIPAVLLPTVLGTMVKTPFILGP